MQDIQLFLVSERLKNANRLRFGILISVNLLLVIALAILMLNSDTVPVLQVSVSLLILSTSFLCWVLNSSKLRYLE